MIDSVKTNDFEMQYLRFGSGKRTLVILPGLSVQSVLSSAAAIVQHYERFCEDYTVYLFDRREALPPVYPVSDMAEDTARAMIALGLSSVCLFGASQGGMMAMLIAAQHPDLVKKIALGSSACRLNEERSAGIEEWVSLAKQGNAEALYLAFGEKVYPPGVFQSAKDLLKQMAATVTPQELARFTILAEGTRGFDISGRLSEIRCPVLAIGDLQDAVLGADATPEIAAYCTQTKAETYLYDGFGHAAYDTAPDYTERLYRFFTD